MAGSMAQKVAARLAGIKGLAKGNGFARVTCLLAGVNR